MTMSNTVSGVTRNPLCIFIAQSSSRAPNTRGPEARFIMVSGDAGALVPPANID